MVFVCCKLEFGSENTESNDGVRKLSDELFE